MSLKNKLLTALATFLFSFYPSSLEAVPANPNNLRKGWIKNTSRKESQRKIKVKVNNKVYLETLIETEKPIFIPAKNEKRIAVTWATTDLEGRVVKDLDICKKADFIATMIYFDKSCNLKKIIEDLSQAYDRGAKLTFVYDITEKALLKLIEIGGKILKTQVSGSPESTLELLKQEIKQETKAYINNIKNKLFQKIKEKGLKGIEEIKDNISTIIKNSIYYKLKESSEKLKKALEILKKGNWSYQDAHEFYKNFRLGWIEGSSTMKFWYTLRNYKPKEIAIKISNALSKGITNLPLKKLIGIYLNKEQKLKEAIKERKKQENHLIKFFAKTIDNMYEYRPFGNPYLYLHPEDYKETKNLKKKLEGIIKYGFENSSELKEWNIKYSGN